MILDLRINLETGEAKILSKQHITKEDIITLITSYFDISIEEIQSDSRDNDVIIAKWFIVYWLIYILDTPGKEIKKLLGYEESSNMPTTILRKLKTYIFEQKDETYTRPYNNLSRLFAGFGIKTEIIENKK